MRIFSTSPIYDDIVKEIQEASIIMVDITNKKTNVFYELGMAHTLKQGRTIMVTQDGFKDMPFDIAHFRIIPCENTIAGKVKFEKKLSSTLTNLLSFYLTEKRLLKTNLNWRLIYSYHQENKIIYLD